MNDILPKDFNQWSFNLQSGKQMQEFLYGFLELTPFEDANDKGNYSVNEETLLRHANEQNVEFCKLLTNFRKIQKASNTYLQDIYRNLNATTVATVHPDYWLNTVETYRSSSSDVNLQNQPKHGDIIKGIAWKLLRGLVASKDYYLDRQYREWLLGEVDYDGAETKVAAIESQDPVLADDLNNDMDQHSHFAIDIFPDVLKGLSYKEVKQKHGDTYRFLTKNSYTFANYYGAIAESIARDFRKSPIYEEYVRNKYNQSSKKYGDWLDYFIKFSVNQISTAQQAFYARYKKLYEWQINVVKDFYEKGYVENKFGFRRRYPLKKNEIINYPIQSTSFLLLLDSLISIEKETEESNFKSHMFGQVHDSGLSNIYKPEIYDWVEMVNHYMINKDHLPFTKIVQLKVDWDVGYHWNKLKGFHFNNKNQFKWNLSVKKS